MPNRRAQNQKNQKPDEHSDLDFDLQDSALSQESQDIQAEQQKKLLLAISEIRKKDKAERKKKSDKEKKLLQVIEKHLNRDLTQAVSLIEKTMEAAEAEFHAFLSKYKVQEGKIHNLWTQILNEQDKLVDLVTEKYQHKSKAITNTASAHLTALSSMNSACNESRNIIDRLIPVSDSDSDSNSNSDFDMTDSDH